MDIMVRECVFMVIGLRCNSKFMYCVLWICDELKLKIWDGIE